MEQVNHTYEEVARILGTLNTELVSKILRGENTADRDLERIVEIAEACRQRARTMLPAESIMDERSLEDKGAKLAGFPAISEILEEYDALRHIRDELIRSFAVRTSDIMNLQSGQTFSQKPPVHVMHVDTVLTPPDNGNEPIESGNGEGITKEFQERLAMVQILLLDLGIDSRNAEEVQMTIGGVTKDMMRDISYVSVFVPRLERLIEVCNEVGNRSFVWKTGNTEDIEKFGVMTKEEKDDYLASSPALGTAVIMREGWEADLRELLQNDDVQTQKTVSNTIGNLLTRTRRESLSFDARILELENFRKINPEEWPVQNTLLGRWLIYWRRKWRDGKLTKEQSEKLVAVGIKPSEKHANQLSTDEWIVELTEWLKMHPKEWPSYKTPLGRWVNTSKMKLRDREFTKEQVEKLVALGLEAAEEVKTIDERICELELWQKNHPEGWPQNGSSLKNWLTRVRRLLSNNVLTKEQEEKLYALGVKPSRKKVETRKTFEERLVELEQWGKNHPKELPPNGSSLGKWREKAKSKLRKGECTPEEAERLKRLGVKEARERKQ